MGSIFPLSEARKNLSELVNEAYYEGKLFGISKGKKSMGVFVGLREWQRIIEVIEKHNKRLSDKFSISDGHKLQDLFKEEKIKGVLDYKALINQGRKY